MAIRSSVDKINSLSGSKRDRLVESLLDKLKRKKALPELRPRAADAVEASLEQERLWFLDQLEPGNPAYLLPHVVRLRGELNIPGLEQSLSELIRRHESLRTSFRSDGAAVFQKISERENLSVPVVDLSGLSEADREKVCRRLMREEARRVFELEESPLLRASLLRSSDQEHFLLLNVHHIVADAWSMALVIQEVGALHEAFTRGRPSPLEELKIQFADYALWQRDTLRQPGILDAKLEYWKNRLSGAATVLEFATDRARPTAQRFRGATERFEIDERVADAIRKFGLEERVTPFITMLTAFGVLLYKYTGQESILIGSPVANRQNPVLEKVIGFFVNTLPLRIDIDGGSDYRGLIAQAREMVMGAYEHQDLPLGALLEHLALQRDPNRTPLFQVMFGVQNVDTPALELGGINLTLVDIDSGASKFDFTVMIHDSGNGMAGTIEYNTDLFERSTIKRLEAHFKVLLEALIRDADRRISEVSIFSESERQQLLVEWNDTSHWYEAEACIHDLFRFEAAQRPDQVALVDREEHVTYYELDARSNQLANYLIRNGIRQEQLIGVCMERGVRMVVALLGILKAGAAYVPLDPKYPVKRLEYMLEDAGLSMLISEAQVREKLPQYRGQTICLDTDWEEVAQHSKASTDRLMTAANAAYVLYTSGSTGQPKGVVGLHGGILNRLNWMWRTYPFASTETCCAKTSLNFVDSVWEIFGPLTKGITLILIPDEDVNDVERLVRVLDDHRVTRLVLVPSLLQAMLSSNADFQKALLRLKIWVTSGEALSKELLESFTDRLPDRQLLNLYGSTEIAGDVTAHPATEASSERNVPIGRPIANSQVYVLGKHLEPTPIGALGELFVGGNNLARGYLNRPEMTAERFVPNQFNGDGDRLFKTGDVARRLDNSDIEYLGRIDDQVKVRGYRVELGEITAALNLHPLVRESVALVSDGDARDKQIVAYIVANSEAEPAPGELRRFLQASLPSHMLPAFFVCLPRMPLLPNGKINRRALPKPEFKADSARYSGPRNAVEELLCGIWADVLGVEQVGINDNFFELGGHSLVATQAISRVRDALQVEIGLRVLFENPTVGGLAEAIERERSAGRVSVAPEMVRAGRAEVLPASYAQQRLWFIQQLEPDSAAYNIPVRVRLAGSLSVSALRQTLQEIVRRHEVLRTRFVSREGQAIQVIDEPREIDLPIVDFTGLTESQSELAAAEIARREAGRPFDLARGPVWRSTLVRTKPDEHLLVVTMHHIASDGWSAGVMMKEFTKLYEAFRAGHRPSLPELWIQYADYALWQREWLRGEVLEQQLEYWRQQLASMPVMELPADLSRMAEEDRRAARQGLALSEDLTQKLIELSRREGVTLFMTLLAGFQILLARYTGQEDIAVGAPVSGRNRSETEGLIGFFVNTLVLRTDLSKAPTLRELLRRVRKTALDAYAHQDVPFEKLVEELHPDRSLSRHPFFEILFNHANAPLSEARLGDLTLAQSRIVESESRFPMTVYVSEDRGQINLQIDYQQALFSSARIATMLDEYRELLSQMAEHPEQAIASYSLVTSESRSLLPDPREEMMQPGYDPVGDMFNEWAVRLPRQVAVSHRESEWSYAELSDRARNISGELISSGLESGRSVMVTGEKSLGMIASVLATCMSGGVLFTLDRALPADRQKFMSDTAGVTHILYVGEVRGEDAWMFERGATCVLKVDPDSGAVTRRGREGTGDEDRPAAPLPHISPQAPAYIFFTSGTTGVPKGVLGSHRGLSHFLKWQRDEFGIGPGDRSAQLTGLSFDVVLRDIFLPLTSGATLCLPDDDEAVSSGKILGWLDRQRISVLHTVPALAQMWLTSPPPGFRMKDLRIVFFAGEPLPDSLVKAWRELCWNRCEIVNLYGPTETTLAKCYYRVPDDCPAGIQPVGRPMPHAQALILRDGYQFCGIGELGEVAIRTPFRTLGYVGGDELNRRRFVKNPFRDDDHDLVYMTGDLARYREDGLIELAGRVDDQVKIRGIRVEPGEVETVLARHQRVKRCAVLAREDESGNKRLIAYVVSAGEPRAAKSELREYLRHRLPDYMVPAAFVDVAELPLTANGKLDRKALPWPIAAEDTESDDRPRTPFEELVAGIWREVLRVDNVGSNKNFFELGGHSLLAIQVISRVRDIFEIEIPLRVLFENPTVAELARAVERERGTDQATKVPAIRRSDRAHERKLSFAQQRLWFLDQLQPGSSTYNIPVSLRLDGHLVLPALEQTLNEIVNRHEVLRTHFEIVDDGRVQVINSAPSCGLRVVDLSRLQGAVRQTAVELLAHAEARRPFDLSRGPLFRVYLIRIQPGEHILLFTIHHILSDAWSMGVLVREVGLLYESFITGNPSPLPCLPIQYADYAIWQREQLQGEQLQKELSFWKNQLTNLPTALDLPFDNSRSSASDSHGVSQTVILSPELSAQLRQLSQSGGFTLFVTMLAAFQLLLSRYSGQDDLSVGTSVTGRRMKETEGLIGFFINTLVLRADLSGSPSFRRFAQRLRTVVLDAYAHSEMPFEKLVEEFNPDRILNRHPFFDVMFNFLTDSQGPLHLPGLTITYPKLSDSEARFTLTLYVREQGSDLLLQLVGQQTLFSAARIDTMLLQYLFLLEQIAADPDRSIDEYSLVTPESRPSLPDPSLPLAEPHFDSVLKQFLDWVARNPQQMAVSQGKQTKSYLELAQSAELIAQHLLAIGHQPGDVVAVTSPRSFAFIASILAVLMRGGVFLPLDQALPPKRRTHMLIQSGAKFMLSADTPSDDSPLDPPLQNLVIAYLDQREGRVIGEPETLSPAISSISEPLPDDPAYIFFTSGSTGAPKGVLGCHKSLSHFVNWQREAFGIDHRDRVAQLSGISFDAMLRDIFLPLTSGATLCLPDPEVGLTKDVLSWLDSQNITCLHTVPSLAGAWLRDVRPNLSLRSLRLLFISGEPLHESLVRRWREAFPLSGEIVNLYGPTETTMIKCFYRVPFDPPTSILPIGDPLPQTQALVLSSNDRLCGIGETGQIVLRTPFRTLGYLDSQHQQPQSFVANPYRSDSRDLLYHTGDRGRYRLDGSLEILGRLDHQLKIHGVRIEPAEIEAALTDCPEIAEATVAALDHPSGDRSLVAYVVLSRDVVSQPESAYLRRLLSQTLPDYMIPSAFVCLDALPLTPTGKIDRAALPAPDYALAQNPYASPRSFVEETVAQIWCEVLRVDRVGIYDSFFEMGGHSLLATQVVSRIHQRLHVEMPLRHLFEHATVEGLAIMIEQLQIEQVGEERLSELLTRLSELTDEKVERLLARQGYQSETNRTG